MLAPVISSRCRTSLFIGVSAFIGLLVLSLCLRNAAIGNALADNESLDAANESSTISIHASGRGNPSIRLADGRDVPTSYLAAPHVQQLLDQNQARPLALASADFNEDGVPDLVGGYAGPSGGIITIQHGNVDAIYPNSLEAQQRRASGEFTEAAFLPQAAAFELPEAADFVGAGDFDADGHWDVVTAQRGGSALWTLSGDGRGNLREANRIGLPGRVTALVVGEINRADGLADVVVGIVGSYGAKALVFEGTDGALNAEPEEFGLPAEASSLALGRLDSDYTMDLAIAAGRDLIVVYGRDRRLSLDEIRRADVPKAKVGRRGFSFDLRSVAVGDFNGDQRTDVSVLSNEGGVYLLSEGSAKAKKKKAGGVEKWKSEELARGNWGQASTMVCARVSSTPLDNLVVVDGANHQLHIIVGRSSQQAQAAAVQKVTLDVESEPIAVLPMRLNVDALSDLVVARSGQSRPSVVLTPQAVLAVNSTGDASDINLGDGVCDVGGGVCTLRAAIQEANALAGADTITFSIGAGPQTIAPLSQLPDITDPVIVDGTTQPGFAGAPIIELSGANMGLANGVLRITSGNSAVRGLVINQGSVHSITLFSGGSNIIEGNYIGTDISGTADLGSVQRGISVEGSPGNTIGGTVSAARNVISGNDISGIIIDSLTLIGSNGNIVQGNYIGTDVSGAADLGNGSGGGVRISGSSNIIGGTSAGARNIITNNDGAGVSVGESTSAGNLIQGNFIGTDASGVVSGATPRDGVFLFNCPSNTVGGTTIAARNIISGNGLDGVVIAGDSAALNQVQGNFIGTDVTGTVGLGNLSDGIFLAAPDNTIGGTAAGAGNVISGNMANAVGGDNAGGIYINGNPFLTTGNQVQGNFIGTDSTGSFAISNNGFGVFITGASGNTIGGLNPAARNVVSGNNNDGIFIINSSGNQVQGNFIGTNSTGSAAIGNAVDGVFVVQSSNNTIGGTTAGAGNVVSGNAGSGIRVEIGSNNIVRGNFVGTDSSGAAPIGNGLLGVVVFADGTAIGSNTIAFNARVGVFIGSGAGNTIISNSIFSNIGLGIDLGGGGMTPNDTGDGDSGANNLQNFPVLTSATRSATGTLIQGRLNSTPNTSFNVQFFSNFDCDPSGFGEGQTFLGSRQVITDNNGNVTFSFSTPIDSGSITATATDPAGNTSEFSNCIAIGAASADLELSATSSPDPVRPGANLTYRFTVTNRGPNSSGTFTIADTLPAGTTFLSCSASSGGFCTGSGSNRRVSFPDLAPGTSATATIVVTVSSSVAEASQLTNTAILITSTDDPDPSDNTVSVTTLVSSLALSINCPPDVTVSAAAGQVSATVTYPAPTVSDNRPGVSITCTPPSGSAFPLGSTAVNCRATDQAGGVATCGFTVTVNPGALPDIDFGSPVRLPNSNPPGATFTVTNPGTSPATITIDSILRTGSSVTSGRITNPDDRDFFSLTLLGPGTPLSPGSTVTIGAGETLSFRVVFNPSIPAVGDQVTGLAAREVLPDVVTTLLTLRQGDTPFTVSLTGRVATALRLIDPDNPGRPPSVTFEKTGNDFILNYAVFDPNLDVSTARYDLLNGSGGVVQSFEVNLAQAIQQVNLTRGQSFAVEQRFTGASSHPEVQSVRLTVSDGETSVTRTASLGSSAASAVRFQPGQGRPKVSLRLPAVELKSVNP